MSGVASAETIAFRHLNALVGEQPPTWQHPAFTTREVRAATLVPGDVLAHPVDGSALAVVAVGHPFGYVVAYVRDSAALQPQATARLHFTPRELVRRAASVGPGLSRRYRRTDSTKPTAPTAINSTPTTVKKGPSFLTKKRTPSTS